MRAWAIMLGGLLLWATHFLGAYAIVSLADIVAAANDPAWRLGLAAYSGGCLLSVGLVGWRAVAWRRMTTTEAGRFAADLALLGAGLAGVAIAWQALPAWIGH